nr:replicative DNA helicase [Desulfobacteraceae bacterium]
MTEQLPQSIDHEKQVLCSCLLDQESLAEAADILTPADFYGLQHQKVWKAMLDIHRKGEPADPVSLRRRLNGSVKASYLAELLDGLPAVSVERDAKTIKDCAALRQALAAAHKIMKLCQRPDQAPADVVAAAQAAFLDVEKAIYGADSWESLRELAPAMADHWEKIGKSKGQTTGIASGFPDLDFLTAGWQSSDLILIAARPAMGKTALALNLIRTAAAAGIRCAMFSLEQPKTQLFNRLAAQISGINLHKFRTGRFSPEDWPKLHQAMETVHGWPVWIDDTGGLHFSEIRRRARKLYRRHRIELLVVDYLQLASGDGENANGRVESISRALKALAKELNIPVIALSQLSRKLEGRNDRRPMLSDLRDSGALEQDADVVAFIYRDEVYNRQTDSPGIAEIDIAKQRNGPTGTVFLRWRERTTRFDPERSD